MSSAPTFSSFPSAAPSADRVKQHASDKSHEEPIRSRRSQIRPSKSDEHYPKRDEAHVPLAPVPAYKDVILDRSRSNSVHALNAPLYRRRTSSIIGLSSVYKAAHVKDRSGVEIRDIRLTRQRLDAPPTKTRRLDVRPADFDHEAAVVHFPQADDSECTDLPFSDDLRRSQVTAAESHLRETPFDIDAWLKYASLHLPPSLDDPLEDPLDTASAEVTLAIIERAIKLNPTVPALHLAALRVAAQISTPEQVGLRWQTVLPLFPPVEALDVWKAYLDWCESHGFSSVERVLAVYGKVIRALREEMLSTPRRHLESSLIYMLQRVAAFLRHAGYEERGFALFQAVIEMTFFKPSDWIAPPSPAWWQGILDAFEAFWTSESPRFGEVNSTGWRCGVRPAAPPFATPSGDWYTQECALLPDCYSYILFEDVRSLVIPVITAEGRLEIVHALLAYLRVSTVPPDPFPSLPDPFLFHCDISWPRHRHRPLEPLRLPQFTSIRHWAFDIDTVFSDPAKWFSCDAVTPLARRCMEQLHSFIPDPRLSIMLLPGHTSRVKSLLSKDRNNVNLWYAYACIEIGRGRHATARSVFANALSLARSQPADAGEDELDLWAGWVQLESDLGETHRAIDLLLQAIGDGDIMSRSSKDFIPPSPSSTGLLRAGQHYDRHLATSGDVRLAFFYNLLVRHDLTGACQVCRAAPNEATYQFLARQLWLNPSRQAARELRQIIDTAIELFPDNTMFRSLGVMSASSQQAAERSIMQSPFTSIVHLLWGLDEMARLEPQLWKPDGSGAERLRKVFSRAVQTTIGRQSLSVWRAYIDFEVQMGGRVKELCYRAVASLGSCKELYMLPFAPSLRGVFSDGELRDWLLLMVERGIRIRAPFEHLLQVQEAPSDAQDEAGLEGDELGFLREAERLRPYT